MKSIKIFVLLGIISILVLSPMYVASKTKTISGAITSVEAGNGSVGTTIKINIGSSKNIKEGDLGWVSKGSEVIAYIKIISVHSNSAIAIVTTHQHVVKVTSGLSVGFKVEVTETKPKSDKEKSEEWFKKGREQHKKEHYEEAVRSFTEAIKINPNYEEAYKNRAYSYSRMKKYTQAISDFKRALEINPNNEYYYWVLAVTYKNYEGTWHGTAKDYLRIGCEHGDSNCCRNYHWHLEDPGSYE
ncbi:MAG: tetratricopeptide repeat protein [Deltaproteobacteria bacterium]|uniref:Tetratricopeptide repeat protein n=1 Tax=Candidatus Zymogenus saltonus TaxID=2844893 RepID=A0A9D8PQB9_9DELT|nr:tetratricopeptide repeat protein [Candidatus Zymogenus saltonus]